MRLESGWCAQRYGYVIGYNIVTTMPRLLTGITAESRARSQCRQFVCSCNHLTYGVWLLGQLHAQLFAETFFSWNMSASSEPSAKLLPPKTTSCPPTSVVLCRSLSQGAVPLGVTEVQRHSPAPGTHTVTPDLSPPYSTSSPSSTESVEPYTAGEKYERVRAPYKTSLSSYGLCKLQEQTHALPPRQLRPVCMPITVLRRHKLHQLAPS